MSVTVVMATMSIRCQHEAVLCLHACPLCPRYRYKPNELQEMDMRRRPPDGSSSGSRFDPGAPGVCP